MASWLRSFKGRSISLSQPVQVYRNLSHSPPCYSIKQGGLVVAHASHLHLTQCKMHVSERGRQRVLQTKRKTVHAWIEGLPCGTGEQPSDSKPLKYNPFTSGSFLGDDKPVTSASHVWLSEKCVTYQE